MLTQRQWKVQQLAEHARNTAINIAAEAAQQIVDRRPMGSEIASIAEETRRLAERVIEAVEKNIFGKMPGDEFDTYVKGCGTAFAVLALNMGLVSCRLREHLPLAVQAEELRNCAMGLVEIYEGKQEYADFPAPMPRSRVVTDTIFLMSAFSGEYRWFENAQFVRDIFYNSEFNKTCIKGNRLVNPKDGTDVPLIRFKGASEEGAVVFIADDTDPSKEYAVLADVTPDSVGRFTMGSLANSRAGVSKPCDADFPVRECWAASDGSDIIFPDWSKFLN